jgi:nicotinate-nucleotide--dimethylbenzimidazole phosphoribosyltransferase
LLDHLNARPLLELDMRLGEGTGAALAIPIIRAAELMLREMADLPGEHPA